MADVSQTFRHLEPRLDDLTREIGFKSVLIMQSIPTHIRVEATGGAADKFYAAGSEGKKGSAFSETHERYCE